VADLQRSLAFYTGHFGFEVETLWPTGEAPTYASLRCGDITLMLSVCREVDAAARLARPTYGDATLYVMVDDADAAHAALTAAGHACSPIRDQDYGMRDFTARDPDGYELGVGHQLARPG
jgi:uncharacterized glyoxalase superfamily protein PhnB